MGSVCPKDLRTVIPVTLRPLPSSRKEDNDIDVPSTSKDSELLIELAHVEIQHIFEPTLQNFEESILKHRIKAIVETMAVSWLEKATQEAEKEEKTPICKAL